MSISKNIKKAMNFFNKFMNKLANIILLLPIYILGIGIVFIVSKIVRKNFLETKIENNKKSYWEDLELKNNLPENNYGQF